MSRSAKVESPDALKQFRLALLKFSEKATNALGEADGEVSRVTMWLENEQTIRWATEVRKRQEAVMKCREALRFKQIFKSPTGSKQSTVDEEKALSVALKRLGEAEQKALNVKKWIRQLHKEAHMYRGAVQRLATTVAVDVPAAAAKISRMIDALEGYLALNAPNLGPAVESGAKSGMSRGDGPEIGGFPGLRHATPIGPEKDKATPADPSIAWTAGEFAPSDAAELEKLGIAADPIDAACLVILASGVQTVPRIYLERSEPAFPGDSGWYIGPANKSAASAYLSLRLSDLLQARPHLEALLALPVGTLAVIDSAGLGAILSPANEDLWAASHEAAPATQAASDLVK